MFDRVTPDMQSYRDEMFGPVLQVVRADSLGKPPACQRAIWQWRGTVHPQWFSARICFQVNVGMVGINVPIPVPVAYHTFGGWKRSASVI